MDTSGGKSTPDSTGSIDNLDGILGDLGDDFKDLLHSKSAKSPTSHTSSHLDFEQDGEWLKSIEDELGLETDDVRSESVMSDFSINEEEQLLTNSVERLQSMMDEVLADDMNSTATPPPLCKPATVAPSRRYVWRCVGRNFFFTRTTP